jgi:hypothetical protein
MSVPSLHWPAASTEPNSAAVILSLIPALTVFVRVVCTNQGSALPCSAGLVCSSFEKP